MGQATKLDKQSNAPGTTQIAGCLGLCPNALQYLNKTRGFSQALVIKAQTSPDIPHGCVCLSQSCLQWLALNM